MNEETGYDAIQALIADTGIVEVSPYAIEVPVLRKRLHEAPGGVSEHGDTFRVARAFRRGGSVLLYTAGVGYMAPAFLRNPEGPVSSHEGPLLDVLRVWTEGS